MKRGASFTRRVACLFSLLMLHTVSVGGASALTRADGAFPAAVAASAMPCANHHGQPTAMAAEQADSAADCSGCCKVKHACPAHCACPTAVAAFSSGLSVDTRQTRLMPALLTGTGHPPQSPLRIFRPPIV